MLGIDFNVVVIFSVINITISGNFDYQRDQKLEENKELEINFRCFFIIHSIFFFFQRKVSPDSEKKKLTIKHDKENRKFGIDFNAFSLLFI